MHALARFASLLSLAVVTGGALSHGDATAQSYPVKPIRLIFGFSPGGGGDVSARLIANKLGEHLGQGVMVENRTGAGGAIADELVAKAPADGYTLLYIAGAATILPALRSDLPYDIERDLAPISLAVVTAFVLTVHPSVPGRDVKALVALARNGRGNLTFSSPGVGSSAHLAGELFNLMAQARMLHVPYKGAPEAATAVAAGDIDVGFPSVTAALPLLAAHRLRALGVSSIKRSSLLPAVPTLDESGLSGYQRGGWNGVLAPAGVPKDIVIRLNALIVKVVHAPEMKVALAKLGYEPQTSTPEQFAAFIHNELVQNGKLVKFAAIKQ